MRSAKQLLNLTLKQRYPRLSLAIVLAVLVHCSALVGGALSFSLLSAPSDINRALTITLEPTPIQGLKESIEKEHQETVNEVQKAQSSAPELALPNEQATQILSQQKSTPEQIESSEVKNEINEEIIEDTNLPEPAPLETEPIEELAFKANNKSTDNAPTLDESHREINKQDSPDQLLSQEKTHSQAKADQVLDTDQPPINKLSDLITANTGLLKIEATPSASPVSIKSKPTELSSASQKIKLSSKQVNLIERKLQRQLRKLSKSNFSEATVSWQHKGQSFVAKVTPVAAKNEMLMDQLMVDVITEQDGRKLTTTLRLKQLAFSNFAQFIDQWDDKVVIHDDELNGRFHSNSAFNIISDYKGTPIFHAKATTAARSTNFARPFRRSKVFLAGLETGVKTIKMPKPSVLFEVETRKQSTAQTIIVKENSRLIFKPNGSVLWQALDSAQPIRKYDLTESPTYFIAAPGVALSVRGTVNGLAAVYSPKRITIEGAIHYASREPISNGGDFLGLISGRSVYIAKRKVIGDGDLQIDSAIYAKDRFAVRGLHGKAGDMLNVFGSITSGSISATEPRYATRIDFDPRFENMRPPGFPVTDRFEIVAEEFEWQIVDDVFKEDEVDEALELSPQLNSKLQLNHEPELGTHPISNN